MLATIHDIYLSLPYPAHLICLYVLTWPIRVISRVVMTSLLVIDPNLSHLLPTADWNLEESRGMFLVLNREFGSSSSSQIGRFPAILSPVRLPCFNCTVRRVEVSQMILLLERLNCSSTTCGGEKCYLLNRSSLLSPPYSIPSIVVHPFGTW